MVCTRIVTFQALADLTCFITRSEHLDLRMNMCETSARERPLLVVVGQERCSNFSPWVIGGGFPHFYLSFRVVVDNVFHLPSDGRGRHLYVL